MIANTPAIYREVISTTLREVRPEIEVFTAEPVALDRVFSRLLPQFVVCNRPTKRVEFEAFVWIEHYPDGASHAVVKNLDGSRKFLLTMDFDKLLAILDGI